MSEVIQLSDAELRKLQLIELEMLVEVDRICRKYDIKYSLSSGTLIGAVRHGGFIPWDDDLDVMFQHEEYEKFFEACKTDLDTSRFFFQDYRTDPGYRWGYGKLRRIGTEYIKKGQEHLKQRTGVCIDLFDFQNVPNEGKERIKYHRTMYIIRKILYSEMGKKNENKLYLRVWYWILALIPSKLVNDYRMNIVEKYRFIDATNVSCEMLPIKSKNGYDSKVFKEYTTICFEGKSFMVTSEWDYYLQTHYGDYMTLPPIDKRRGVMDAVQYRLGEMQHYDDSK